MLTKLPPKQKKLAPLAKKTAAGSSLKPVVKNKLTRFRIHIRSRHPTHGPLRNQLPLLPFRSVVRFGSTTALEDNHQRVQCNTVNAIRTSANKLLMKQAFKAGNVKTALWWTLAEFQALTNAQKEEQFPIVVKTHMGSRNNGNHKLDTLQQFNTWQVGKTVQSYIVEHFYDFNREYRLHVTANGCFYTNRKVIKNNTPENERWYRNDSNSNWLLENNASFDKPTNWGAIETECVKALKAVGLDFGACDVKVQSATNKDGKVRNPPDFIVIEINSAPSFGDGTLKKYLIEIPRILQQKRNG